jgi:hypothetical protein
LDGPLPYLGVPSVPFGPHIDRVWAPACAGHEGAQFYALILSLPLLGFSFTSYLALFCFSDCLVDRLPWYRTAIPFRAGPLSSFSSGSGRSLLPLAVPLSSRPGLSSLVQCCIASQLCGPNPLPFRASRLYFFRAGLLACLRLAASASLPRPYMHSLVFALTLRNPTGRAANGGSGKF